MDLPRTFADIPDRESALTSPVTRVLLNSLPHGISRALTDLYLDSSCGNSRDVLDYFVGNSAIFSVLNQSPGSALGSEYLYTRDVSMPIDRYFVDCKAGFQIHKRLLALWSNLPVWINRLLSGKNSILIDNIGSGTGRDMIGALAKNRHLASRVKVRHIDPDAVSLSISEKLARAHGIMDSFSFHCHKLGDVPPAGADMALLIGVLCPLHRRVGRAVLRNITPYVRKGGLVIYSTALYRMVIEDPFTDFLMRFGGWQMTYKSEEESENLARSLGWRIIDTFYDEPLHYHSMVVAEIP